MNSYTIRKTDKIPLFRWEDFDRCETLRLNTPPEGVAEKIPVTEFRCMHDGKTIYGMFRVQEEGIVARKTKYLDMVCLDSCCEFFFQPDVGKGYFNLEMNAGGTYLLYYVRDPAKPKADGNGTFMDFTPVDFQHGKLITVKTDLPKVIDPPMMEKTLWHLMFTIPLEAITPYCGNVDSLSGRAWRGNVYKCADKAPYPAWQTWMPLTGTTNFHTPQFFGTIQFEDLH